MCLRFILQDNMIKKHYTKMWQKRLFYEVLGVSDVEWEVNEKVLLY